MDDEYLTDIKCMIRTGQSEHPDPLVRAEREAINKLALQAVAESPPLSPQIRGRIVAVLHSAGQVG